MEAAAPVLQNLGLTPKQQNYSPPHSANVKRLIILIKHQDRRIYHDATLNNFGYFSKKIPGLQIRGG
jgi:hypothetical protein